MNARPTRAPPLRPGALAPVAGLLLALAFAFSAYGNGLPAGNQNPALAFDFNHNRYLVVYDDYNADSGFTIYGQLLDADGTAYNDGAPFAIAGPYPTTPLQMPAVAFDPTNDQYLVVWQENVSDFDVLGRLVAADGTPAESAITISSAVQDQTYPSVAHDLVNQRFLVVWQESRTAITYDVFGQLIDADGNLYDPDPGDATDLTDPTVNFAISQEPVASFHQQFPQAAFDPVSGRYLVVWQDTRNTVTEIYGQLVDADGALFGTDVATNFGIGTVGIGELAPAVANDPLTQRFLVVWQDARNHGTNGYDIYGRLVPADGSTPPAEFAISDAPEDQTEPAVAYDLASPGFLVTFSHPGLSGPLFQIDPATGEVGYIGSTGLAYGTHSLAYDGTTLYTADYMYPATLYSVDPDTATSASIGTMGYLGLPEGLGWDPAGSALYAIGPNYNDSLGQTLFSVDTGTGGTLLLGALSGFTANDMAFDAAGTLYVVRSDTGELLTIDKTDANTTGTSSSAGPTNVPGLAFGAGGTLYGLAPDTTATDLVSLDTGTGAATVVHTLAGHTTLSALAFDAVAGKLFAISSLVNGGNIEGQRVEAGGTLAGSSTDSLPIAVWDDHRRSSTTATNPYCGNALVSYSVTDQNGVQGEIRSTALGTCASQPWLAYAPGDISTRGVTAGAAAGDTFTFQVLYSSAADTAPAQAELWIDLNRDGSYTAPTAGTTAGGGSSGPGMLALAGLLGVAGLALLRVRGMRRMATGLAVLGLVLGLTALGMSACQSSSSGGGADNGENEEPPPPGAPQERFAMTAVDSGDTSYADGKLYTVDVTIAESGTYTFVFAFSDATNAAIGAPAVPATLTVP